MRGEGPRRDPRAGRGQAGGCLLGSAQGPEFTSYLQFCPVPGALPGWRGQGRGTPLAGGSATGLRRRCDEASPPRAARGHEGPERRPASLGRGGDGGEEGRADPRKRARLAALGELLRTRPLCRDRAAGSAVVSRPAGAPAAGAAGL